MNKTDNEPNALWDSLKNNLCEAIPADTYRVWFNNVRLARFERDSLEIVAPNEFSAIWIRDNYMDVIQREAKRVAGRTVNVNYMANLNWKKIPIPFRITVPVLAQPVKASPKVGTRTK
jgi:chromosomal replication initiation ATPase DnaA